MSRLEGEVCLCADAAAGLSAAATAATAATFRQQKNR
jgi:hypothetical protein